MQPSLQKNSICLIISLLIIAISQKIYTVYLNYMNHSKPRKLMIESLHWLVIVFALIATQVQAGNIITVAGNGTAGYSGDGGPATSAAFKLPVEVVVDSSNDVYIADANNYCVRKLNNVSGVITTYAGICGSSGFSGDGGAATSAKLKTAVSVAVDNSGNLYVADYNDQRVRKVDASGNISTLAGIGSSGFSGDGGSATAAKLSNPRGVTVDSVGNVYIADNGSHHVRKVDTSGIITTVAGTGTAGYSGDGGAATSAKLNGPFRVAVDSSDNLYITDNGNHCVRKVDNSTGIITTVAGSCGTSGFSGDSGAATSAKLNSPTGVSVDRVGNIYVADMNNHRIRQINTSGIITTVAGTGSAGFSGDNGSATSAQLNSPRGMAVDSAGNVYIADTSNYRIRSIANQMITFNPPASVTINDSPITLSATGGGSGNAVTFDSTTPTICTVSGTTLTIVAIGTCTVTADQAGTATYGVAPQVSKDITVNKPAQTITGFSPASSATYGDSPITLSATGGASGNTVTFASTTPSVCTVSGSTLTIVGAGTCTVTADQAGDTTYSAATQVSKNITVGKKTITAQADNKSRAVGAADPTFTFSYTGLVGSDTISTPPSATTTATNSSPVGSYPITCTGGSDAKYTISSCTDGTLSVTLPSPSMTVAPAVATVALGTAVTANFTVTGSPTPTGTVTVTDGVVSCSATVAAGTCNLTPTTAGTKTLTATYAGDSNYGTVTATAPVGIAGVISSVTSLSLVEGATGTYTLKLATAPNSDVVITLTPNTQVTVSPTTLTFTTANWNAPQTVTVTAVNDTVYQGNRTVSTTQAITTADTTQYLTTFSIPAFSVAITDNETPPYVPPSTPPITYELKLKMDGTGKGTISGTKAGIFDEGTLIKLTATADTGSTLTGWTPTGCGKSFYLQADTTCTATFDQTIVTPPPAPVTYNLTTATDGTGTGIIQGTAAGQYTTGTLIQLSATADSGSEFTGWTPSTCASFTLTADTHCVATFELSSPVVITPTNTPPENNHTLADVLVSEGDAVLTLNLANHFKDLEDAVLNYQVISQDTNVTTAQVNAEKLTLNFNKVGTSFIEVTAYDSQNAQISAVFLVTVASKPVASIPTPISTPVITPTCEPVENYEGLCNGKGEVLAITKLNEKAVIANFIIDKTTENKGFMTDVTLLSTGKIIGGKLSGTVNSLGTIRNIEFVGKELSGGTVGGYILNSSPVYGKIHDVNFEPCALIEGGYWGGILTGNEQNPVYLNNLTLATDTVLNNAILGNGVRITGSTTKWKNVQLASEQQGKNHKWNKQSHVNSTACFAAIDNTFMLRPEPQHRGQTAEMLSLAIDKDNQHYSFNQSWLPIQPQIAEIKVSEQRTLPAVLTFSTTLFQSLPSNTIALFLGYRLANGEIVYSVQLK